LRPSFTTYQNNELTKFISKLAKIFQKYSALNQGGYRLLFLTNRQFIFERYYQDEKLIIAINADEKEFQTDFNPHWPLAFDLLSQQSANLNQKLKLSAYSIAYWQQIKEESNK